MISNHDRPLACIQIARQNSPSEWHKHRRVHGRDCEIVRSAVPPYPMRICRRLVLPLWSEGSEESHLRRRRTTWKSHSGNALVRYWSSEGGWTGGFPWFPHTQRQAGLPLAGAAGW